MSVDETEETLTDPEKRIIKQMISPTIVFLLCRYPNSLSESCLHSPNIIMPYFNSFANPKNVLFKSPQPINKVYV